MLIRFSSLGDVVKCTALPRLIKAAYPGARLTMVTASDFLELIADNPHLDQAIGLDRRAGRRGFSALRRRLASQRWDLIVDVHKSLRSRLLGLALRGPRSAYSKRTLQRLLLLNFRLNSYRPAKGKEEDFLAGLAPYGVRDDGRGTELNLRRVAGEPALREKLGAELKTLARWRKRGRAIVGLAPVAAWELKKWPLAHFRRLAEALAEKTDAGLVLFGGPGDKGVETLLEGLPGEAISLVGRTSLLQSAYFASLADLVVANDTGMTHLAEAVGTRVVALYGPTSRELGYYPVNPLSRAVELPLFCRPCSKNGQGNCGNPYRKACLEGITPETVLRHVVEMLADRS